MEREEVIAFFKKIYPERDITCFASKINDTYWLIEASFPDGEFYFIASKNSLSSSFNTKEDALKSI